MIPALLLSAMTVICHADLNDDGIVNSSDVGPLITQFGTTGPDADFNEDGVVNGLDIGPFIAAFGQGCAPEAALTWTNPTKNTDGSVLNNLQGIRVYWIPGGELGVDVSITEEFVITGLSQDVLYSVYVTAYNLVGESAPSNIAEKTTL